MVTQSGGRWAVFNNNGRYRVAYTSVDMSQHILAAGCIALLIAGQCLRDAIWMHGFEVFNLRRARA